MNDRTLDQALDMTPSERAELRARVEKLTVRHAKTLLFQAAGRADDAPRGSVEQWDARTSANDARTALSLALGADVDSVHPVIGTHPPIPRRDVHTCPECGAVHDLAECNGAQCDCCAAIEREASQ